MASLLQQQLNLRRQAPQGVSTVTPDRSVPAKASLLFEQTKAEALDLETILNIGNNGLMELRKYDERFAAFETTLFNPSSLGLARPQMSREALQKLDASVEQFLFLLSPYFLLKPAHKALEWLLRRYQIHVNNVTALIKCILPYHETALFARVVRLCKLGEEWRFLHNVKKYKSKMDRATLVQNCLKDLHLLTLICELVTKNGDGGKMLQVSDVHLSLYVATVLELISRTARVTDDLLHVLLPHILIGLEAQKHRSLQVATYMIVAQLSTRTVFTEKLISTLVKRITRHATEATEHDALMALVYLAQTQTITALPDDALRALLHFRSLATRLADLAQKFDISNFLRLLLNNLLSHCMESDDTYVNVFKQILQLVALDTFVPEMIDVLLRAYTEASRESQVNEQIAESIKRYLRLIDARYPSQLDVGLNAALQSLKNEARNEVDKRSKRKRRNSASRRDSIDAGEQVDSTQKSEDRIFDFIAMTFRGTSHQMLEESSTTLYLALQHPDEHFRLLAVEKVVTQLTEGELEDEQFEEFIKDALLDCLTDDSPQIVARVFQVADILLSKVEPEALFKQLSNIITQERFRAPLKTKALSILSDGFLAQNPSYMPAVQSLMFDSLLAQSRKNQLRFSISALPLASTFAKGQKDSIFKDVGLIADKLQQYLDRIKEDSSKQTRIEIALKVNTKVINCLANTICANAGAFCRQLVSCIEKDQGKLLAILVLNKALAISKSASGQSDKNKTVIRETLFKLLTDRCSLADLLSGDGITAQEANQFNEDLTLTLETGLPSSNLFKHFIKSSRPHFYSKDRLEQEKRQAEHALYLFSLHNITDSFPPKPSKEQFSLIKELFVLFISSPSFDLFAPHVKVLASRISAVTSLPLFLSSFLAERDDKAGFSIYSVLMQSRCIKLLNTYLMAFLPEVRVTKSTAKTASTTTAASGTQPEAAEKHISKEQLKMLKEREPELRDILLRFFIGVDSNEKEIRVSTFFALSTLATLFRCLAAQQGGHDVSTVNLLAKFIDTLAPRKADFIADRSFFRKFLARLLSDDAANKSERKDSFEELASKFTADERGSLLRLVLDHALNKKTPKYLRLYLFHMLSDVASSQMVITTHSLMQDILKTITTGSASYFDANTLQLLLTALLKSSLVHIFNQREGGKSTKKELVGGTKFFDTYIQALNTPTSIAYSSNENVVTPRHTSLQLVDYCSPRLCVLKSLVETSGFHFMAGLSLDNKKTLFMHFIEILLESSYTDPSSASEEAPKTDDESYPRYKDADISVVDNSKNIIKSIIRAMNLSSELILKCLQEQIGIAKNRAKALARKEKATGHQEDAGTTGAGKKSKAPRATDEADSDDGEEPVSAKRARVSTKETEDEASTKSTETRKQELLVMQRLNLILEIILSQIPFVQDKAILLQPLATLLDLLVQGQKREASPEEEDNEYTKQLILSCLESISQRIYVDLNPKAQSDSMDLEVVQTQHQKNLKALEKRFQGAPETIVQCIRVTNNTRTQNKALLALGSVATLYPDLVLRHVMPVFTFMGASTIRHDDNYTFTVMQKSLRAILPSMVKQGGIGVSDVLRIFVDNFQHVPVHRRLHLFASVLQTLSLKYLPDLLVLFLVKHVTEGPQEQTRMQLDESVSIEESLLGDLEEETTVPGFCHSLCDKVPVSDLCSAFVPLVEVITDNVNTTNDMSKYCDKSKMTKAQVIELERTVVDFMLDHFASKPFLNALLNLKTPQVRAMQPIYLSLFRRTLAYAQQCANKANELLGKKGKKGKAQIELWTNQTQGAYEVIRMLNSFMSTPMFLETVSDLLVHPDAQMRQRALELFNEKVEEQKSLQEKSTKEEGQSNSTKLFLDMVPKLTNIVKDKDTAEDMALTKQTALLSLEILSRNFAAAYPTHFLGATFDVVSAAMRHTNTLVQGSALVCQAAICLQLGAKMVPKIPKFMPQVVAMLKKIFARTIPDEAKKAEAATDESAKDDANLKLLQMSALSALEVTVDGIGQFLSPYLRDIIQIVVPVPDAYPTPQISERVEGVLSVLATKIEARLLLPAIFLCSSTFKKAASSVVRRFAGWVSSALSSMPREAVQTHHDRLFKFFLEFLDLRRLSNVHEKAKRDVKTEKDIDSVEDSFIEAYLNMVMKLNELTFKPLFLRTTHWITDVAGTKSSESTATPNFARLITFWRLANALADKLKAIFVPYYGYLLDDAVAYLSNQKDVFATEDKDSDEESDEDSVQLISSKKVAAKKKQHKDSDTAKLPEKRITEQRNEFFSLVLSSLHKCFLYDSEGFITPEKFDRLVPALVAQIENNSGALKAYQSRVTDHLIPAISQLAVNVSDDKLWKTLNYQVLLTTRNSAASVRFAGLKVVEAFYQRLGEEFLPLLPETVPFLAELMEDSAIEVEQLCQEVIALIDKYLPEGESIASYFQ